MKEKLNAVIEIEDGCLDEFKVKIPNLIRFPDAPDKGEKVIEVVKKALKEAGCNVSVKVR